MLILFYCLFVTLLSLTLLRVDAQVPVKQADIAKLAVLADTTSVPLDSNVDAMLQRINEARTQAGRPILRADVKLNELAHMRANDMVSRQYYAHESPDKTFFNDYFQQYDISATYACENLDLTITSDPNQVVQDWMNSNHGHRECVLSPNIDEAGYAVELYTDAPVDSATDTPIYVVVAIHANAQ